MPGSTVLEVEYWCEKKHLGCNMYVSFQVRAMSRFLTASGVGVPHLGCNTSAHIVVHGVKVRFTLCPLCWRYASRLQLTHGCDAVHI